MASTATKTRYRIDGMDCASCASKIDTAVRRIAGVEEVSVSVAAGTMTVQHAPESDLAALERKVSGLGYTVAALTEKEWDAKLSTKAGHHHDNCDHDHDHAGHSHAGDNHHGPEEMPANKHGTTLVPASGAWWNSAKGRLTIASGGAFVAAYAVHYVWPAVGPWVFAAAVLVGLVPIARRALMAALSGTPFSIEMLMTVAAVGAVIIGAGEEAAAVVFLFLVGELLEGVAAGKARSSIQALTSLVPKTAFIEEGGKVREVRAESLAVGAIILVRPGDRIPADGGICEGESAIDESPVTGESVPVHKGMGDAVFAGTINGDGVLRIEVTAAAADNTIARVVKLVEEAQESKAPTERFIDRFSRWYTPAVVIVAVLVAIVPPLAFTVTGAAGSTRAWRFCLSAAPARWSYRCRRPSRHRFRPARNAAC